MKKLKASIFLICVLLSFVARSTAQGCYSDILLKRTTIGGVTALAPISGRVNICLENDKGVPCSVVSVHLFSDSLLTKPISNPVSTDANGNYTWCAAARTYIQQPVNSCPTCGIITKSFGPVTIYSAEVGSGGPGQSISELDPLSPFLWYDSTTGTIHYTNKWQIGVNHGFLMPEITIPNVSNIATGEASLYVESTTHELQCETHNGASCLSTTLPVPLPPVTRLCEIHIWGTGVNGVLQNTDDEASSCYNGFSTSEIISSVVCWANAGSPTVIPEITGSSSSTSILSGALTCGAGSFVSGSLSPTGTLGTGTVLDTVPGPYIRFATSAICADCVNADSITIGGTSHSILSRYIATFPIIGRVLYLSVASISGVSIGDTATFTSEGVVLPVGSSIDANINSAGGTATNIRMVFTLTRTQ